MTRADRSARLCHSARRMAELVVRRGHAPTIDTSRRVVAESALALVERFTPTR